MVTNHARSAPHTTRKWSRRVTRESDAFDLTPRVVTWRDPKRIAHSLQRSAEHSRRRKGTPHQSAMSMLTFYLNRGGRNLSAERGHVRTRAKAELRRLRDRNEARAIRRKKGRSAPNVAFVFLEAATVLPVSQLHNFRGGHSRGLV